MFQCSRHNTYPTLMTFQKSSRELLQSLQASLWFSQIQDNNLILHPVLLLRISPLHSSTLAINLVAFTSWDHISPVANQTFISTKHFTLLYLQKQSSLLLFTHWLSVVAHFWSQHFTCDVVCSSLYSSPFPQHSKFHSLPMHCYCRHSLHM